jgi:hypothetical protein
VTTPRGNRGATRGPAVWPHRLRVPEDMGFLLWVVAVSLVAAGLISLLRKRAVVGAGLITLGLIIGPASATIYH